MEEAPSSYIGLREGYGGDLYSESDARTVSAGTKWSPREIVLQAQAALRHSDIIGKVQHGQGEFNLSMLWPTWRQQQLRLRFKGRKVLPDVQVRFLRHSGASGWSGNVQKRTFSGRQVWDLRAGKCFHLPKWLKWIAEDATCWSC